MTSAETWTVSSRRSQRGIRSQMTMTSWMMSTTCWTTRCGTRTWRTWSSSKRRSQRKIVTLISGTRKSKTKIKWTTKITTRPKGIKTNSSPTTIRRTSQKEKKKAVRLRRVSARRASEKKMAMNRVKKKAQSI